MPAIPPLTPPSPRRRLPHPVRPKTITQNEQQQNSPQQYDNKQPLILPQLRQYALHTYPSSHSSLHPHRTLRGPTPTLRQPITTVPHLTSPVTPAQAGVHLLLQSVQSVVSIPLRTSALSKLPPNAIRTRPVHPASTFPIANNTIPAVIAPIPTYCPTPIPDRNTTASITCDNKNIPP